MLVEPARRLSFKVGAIDVPAPSKLHSRITARLGGVAVFFGFWAGLLAGMLVNVRFRQSVPSSLLGVLTGSSLAFLVGLRVDLPLRCPRWFKVAGVLAAAVISWSCGVEIRLLSFGPSLALQPWMSFVTTVLWLFVMANAFDFMDGLDGLAGGIALIASTTLFIVSLTLGQPFYAALYAAIGGAVLGFGRYNRYPAVIFLGDCGSLFIGFLLAAVSVSASHKSTALGAMAVPLLVLGLPLSDTFFSIWYRFMAGRRMYYSDRWHIHHRLLRYGYTQRQVVWMIYLVCIALCGGVFLLVNSRSETAALVLVAGALLLSCFHAFHS